MEVPKGGGAVTPPAFVAAFKSAAAEGLRTAVGNAGAWWLVVEEPLLDRTLSIDPPPSNAGVDEDELLLLRFVPGAVAVVAVVADEEDDEDTRKPP